MKKYIRYLAVSCAVAVIFAGWGMKKNASILEEALDASHENSQVTLRTVSMYGGDNKTAYIYRDINNRLMEEIDGLVIEDNSKSSNEEWKASVNADFAVGNEPDVIHFFTDEYQIFL